MTAPTPTPVAPRTTEAPRIRLLTTDEQRTVNTLVAQLVAKAPRNRLRSGFYDMKNAVRDLGISTPPSMQQVNHVLGWSAKAVDILNRRCPLDGFVMPTNRSDDDFGVGQIWTDNYLDVEASQAGLSSLIHATAFLIAHQGDPDDDEPAVVITAKDAMSGTGEWSAKKRKLTSFLSVIETDGENQLTHFVLYLPNVNVICRRVGRSWDVERREHVYGLPVEPLVYQPRLGRPFGSSRISRSVMSLHQAAVRSFRRSEATAEFYAATRVILLGVGEEAFAGAGGTKWKAALDVMFGLPDVDDAQAPNGGRAGVEQIAQASQQPHLDQLRSLAQLFAGETNIPLSSLGISGDANPTSEGAYDAGRDDLYAEAEGTTAAWSPAWGRTMLRGVAMRNGWAPDEIPDEAKSLQPKWRDPRTPSRAAAADAAVKTLSVFPWLGETREGMELFGFDEQFITRAMIAKRAVNGRATLARIFTPPQPVTGDKPTGS